MRGRPTRRDFLGSSVLLVAGAALASRRARAQTISPAMDALSRYMAAALARPLPLEAAAKAKQHVLDTFAAMISGSELAPGRAALAFARAQAGGRLAATIAGSTLLASATDAALVNGVLAHSD